MYKRILVPVDGSRTSERGLAEAIRMAKAQRAALSLLHVVDERAITQSLEGGAIALDELVESLRSSGRQILAKAEAAARKAKVPVASVMVESVLGGVSDAIVKQAGKLKADLIVIGTHGRRGLTRLVMGSDAEGVVRDAPVPVLLVRAR